ncbi:MAG: Gmad2 immunoglobulin-like domain-containing protein [bacterium]|nr:Gmad2 immunoglobulin-like domain-containing protein [bacterium]
MRDPLKIAAITVAGLCTVGALLVVLLMTCGGGRCAQTPQPAATPTPVATQNFSDCVAAGFPVQESLPRQCRTPDGRAFVEGPARAELDDRIYVDSPLPDSMVKSPLVVTGAARGTWYFEASFPVILLDGNNKEIAVQPAQAQGEWMTEDFVPFLVRLEFTAPQTDTGTLVLEKDNPSGLPEHAAELRFPVRFR